MEGLGFSRGLAAIALALSLTSCLGEVSDPISDWVPGRPAADTRGVTLDGFEPQATGLRHEVFSQSLAAYRCEGSGWTRPLLTVIDYSLPSTAKRLWVLDLAQQRTLFHELVAHGRETGEDLALAFSNEPGSKQSSLGLFRTLDVYEGRHGLSLRLEGLDVGVNHLALDRAIVIHGAAYVNRGFAREHGRLGRSWGCPALDEAVAGAVIDVIRDGTALFAYHDAIPVPTRCVLDGSTRRDP